MTTQPNKNADEGAWLAPMVEFWVDDSSDGQSVVVVGERSDGQRFFGSFWQPALHDNETGAS